MYNAPGIVRKLLLNSCPEEKVLQEMLALNYGVQRLRDFAKPFDTFVNTQGLRFKSSFEVTADIDIAIPLQQVFFPFADNRFQSGIIRRVVRIETFELTADMGFNTVFSRQEL